MESWKIRLRAEISELKEKTEKLAAFIETGKHTETGQEALLVIQLHAMQTYLAIVSMRWNTLVDEI